MQRDSQIQVDRDGKVDWVESDSQNWHYGKLELMVCRGRSGSSHKMMELDEFSEDERTQADRSGKLATMKRCVERSRQIGKDNRSIGGRGNELVSQC